MSERPQSPVLPYLSLAWGILSLGFSAIFVRLAAAPGSVVNLYRMGIAAVMLALPFGIRTRTREDRVPAQSIRFAVLGGLFFAVDLVLWSTGVNLSGATNPTLMANTAPLWVGLGAQVFFGEKRGRIFWIGLLLALMGAGWILGQDSLQSADIGLGTMLGLLASFFYGGYFLLTQKGRSGLDSLSYFWIVSASAALFLGVYSLIFNVPVFGYSRFTYLNFIALGVVVQVFGWYSINYAQGYLPAAIVAPTLLGQPVMTAVLSHLLIGERLTPRQAGAGLIVLTGVYLVHRSQHRGRRPGVDGEPGAG